MLILARFLQSICNYCLALFMSKLYRATIASYFAPFLRRVYNDNFLLGCFSVRNHLFILLALLLM